MHSVAKRVLTAIMPSPVRQALGKLYCRLAGRTNPTAALRFPSQEASFLTLLKLGWSPSYVVDVGAYEGQWTSMIRTIFPDARVLMIEPQEHKREVLAAACAKLGPGVSYENALLGASDGACVPFVEMETGSSVFEETSPYERNVVNKTLRTLDNVLLAQSPFQRPDCLKLDTQGYELEVLRGASEILPSVQAILLETSLVATNAGCPLIGEVMAFLDAQHFALFDFCSQIRRKDGVLWQTDLLFIRRDGAIRVPNTLTHENWF